MSYQITCATIATLWRTQSISGHTETILSLSFCAPFPFGYLNFAAKTVAFAVSLFLRLQSRVSISAGFGAIFRSLFERLLPLSSPELCEKQQKPSRLHSHYAHVVIAGSQIRRVTVNVIFSGLYSNGGYFVTLSRSRSRMTTNVIFSQNNA